MNNEIRSGQAVELRDGEGVCRVEGYAAVFNETTQIGNWFLERIAPGAFAEAIGRDDVSFLVNHAGLPLARTGSGTLKLSEDARGLAMATDLDLDDPDVAQIVPKMRRGDLSKMSFAFRALREEWDETGDMPVRTLLEVELADVSIVNVPAYDGTEIALRAREEARGQTGGLIPAEIVRTTLRHKLALAARGR